MRNWRQSPREKRKTGKGLIVIFEIVVITANIVLDFMFIKVATVGKRRWGIERWPQIAKDSQ